MKGQLEELGEETDENVENISKMQGQILNMTKGKVNIFDGAGNFKSTYEIMQGIAQVWDELSSIDQADLLETIAGKHRANDVAALLSNWKNVEAAVKSASEAEGSAARENAKYIDSIQGRLDKLTTVWQSFANTFMSSDFLKGAVSALTTFVELIEKLVKNIGTLGTIGLGAGIFGIFKHRKNGFSFLFKELSGFGSLAADIWKSGGKITDRFKDIGRAAGVAGGDIAGKLTGSLSGMIGGIGLAVAAIGLIVTAIKKAKEEESRLRQETIQTSDEFLEAAGSFEQAYIKYSGRTDLTAEEESELETAIKGTVDALGDKSSALQGVVNSSNDYLSSLEAITKAELKAANNAAKEKKTAAEKELKSIVEPNVEQFLDGDSSSVNVVIERRNAGSDDPDDASEDEKIAREAAGKYYQLLDANRGSKYYGFELPSNASVEEIVDYYYSLVEAKNRLLEKDLGETDTFDSIDKAIKKMSESIAVYEEGVYDAAKAQYQLVYGIPKTTEAYLKMRESVLNDIGGTVDTRKAIANTLDSEYGQMFDLTTNDIQSRKLIGVLDEYGEEEASKVETFLNMRTAVNNNECTVGDYLSQFEDIKKMRKDWSDESKDEFDLSFGMDTDKIYQQYDELSDYITKEKTGYTGNVDFFEIWQNITTNGRMNPFIDTEIDQFDFETREKIKEMEQDEAGKFSDSIKKEKEEIEKFLDGLSASELAAVVNLKTEIDWENGNWDDILNQIEEEAKLIEAISFSIDLNIETEKLENLTSAIAESVSGAGLGTESMSLVEDMFGDLDSYDQSKLFERTANGIRLNSDELRKLNDEYKKKNVDGLDDKIDALGERYLQTREELSDLTYGTEEYNQKAKELSSIEAQINAAETLAAQYEGITSAYQSWQRAEASGSQRDMYESMIEGFENVDDEISRGWLDDGTIEFLRLIKGENISATATTKELMKAYESLDDTIKHTSYSVRDFFTVDEDGNSTNTGVYNFLDAIGQLEEEKFGGKDVVKRDKNGNIIAFDFQIAGGDKAIAEALGISEELVQIMVRAADDAGFVISMDGTYQQLDVLKEKAQEAANKLKDTFKKTKHEFDLNTGNEGTVLKDYNEALKIWEEFKNNKNEDGTVNMSVEGAEEAYTLVSTLQSMVDRLSEPVYMELNATQVEKDIQTPLSKLQEYERLTQQENQLKLKGTDTTEIDNAQKEIIDYFENLSPEIKAQLGIKDLSREEIQKKVEAGEIEIPATIDLQVEMNNTMRDMVNVALYNAGIIDKEELEARVDVSLYADKVDASDVEEKTEDAVEDKSVEKEVEVDIVAKYANDRELSEMIKDYTPSQQKVIVEYFAEHDEVDKYTPEQKEALVKFIAEVGDINSYTPEEKQAIVEYLTDSGDPDSWTPEQKEAVAKFIRESGDVDNYTPDQKEAIAKFIRDSIDPDTYNPDDKDATVTYNRDSSEVDNYNPKNFVRTVTYKIKEIVSKIASGGKTKASQRTGADPAGNDSEVNGTAHVNGTTGRAFRQGSWGTKNSGTALGGELGREILVRNGKWFTIGDNGAEFFQYKKGDIIFNHCQTEELLANGKVTSGDGRAKALVGGTAFANGSKGFGGIGKVVGNAVKKVVDEVKKVVKKDSKKSNNESKKASNNETKSTSNNNSSSSSSGSEGRDSSGGTGKVDGKGVGSDEDEDKFEETFDWVEIKISRIERAIKQLDQQANNVYKNWSERNEALAGEIDKVGEEISIQQSAYNEYIKEANSVGLDESYAKRVREGTIDIEDFEGDNKEALVEKIKEYKEWYEKALKCQDAIDELKEKEASLYSQRFDHVSEEYDNLLQGYEHTESMLNEYINQAEEKGYIVSKNYYEALIGNEEDRINVLKQEQSALIKARDEAVANDEFDKYSEDWYRMCAEIDSITQSIEEGTTSLIEYNNAIRDVDWQIFDLIQERISDITAESEFLIELMSNKDLFDDNGKFTEQGVATVGLHTLNYNTSMYQADDYGVKVAEIDSKIASGEYDQNDVNNLLAKRKEYIEAQRECILNAESEKNAIRDLVEEGINLELDALQERIDLHNEELDSMKDLYDYQKNVEEQTKNIASLRKQLGAYEGFDDEETRAKVQELKISLEEAEADLKETEYDKFISDQTALLDNLYTEYETILNSRLDNIDFLLEQVIDGINIAAGADGTITSALGENGAIAAALGSNATTIGETLKTEVGAVGTKLSTAMSNIWLGDGSGKAVIDLYGKDFQNKSTLANDALNKIKSDVAAMVDDVDKDAQKKVEAPKTQPSTKANPTKNTTPTNKPAANNTNKPSGGDGKAKVGDKVKFVSGQYYYDSQGEKPLGYHNRGKEVYITSINTAKWATHPYHISTGNKLGKGDLGWLKLNQLSGYAVGKQNFLEDEVAWTQENGREFIVRPSDGAILTPVAKGDSVLTSAASNNIWDMANSPAEFIKNNLGVGSASVPSSQNVNNNITQHFENITFSMPNVHDYNDLLREMQRDPKFEKLVLSMTIDQIAGKSGLAKGKSIRY